MKEKQAFIFFVGYSPHEWERNQEIFLFYLNRISVNEDDQCEVIWILSMISRVHMILRIPSTWSSEIGLMGLWKIMNIISMAHLILMIMN